MLLQSYFNILSIAYFLKAVYKCLISVAEYPKKPVIVLGKVQTSQKFGRITKKKGHTENCAPKFCYAFQAKIPKDFILESPNFMAQWPIFSTKLAEKCCLEFATLGDATLGAG